MRKIIVIVSLGLMILLPLHATAAEPSPERGTEADAAGTADTGGAVPENGGEPGMKDGGEPERLYGVGSVSKVFTAAAVMKLTEQGLIDLDEPLVSYLPDFQMADPRYTQITPRMLLNHSAGLMGSTQEQAELIDDNDTYNHDHLLLSLSTQTLKHQPGDRSIYSNDSFVLAEILVEQVSGRSFTDFIRQELLTPLGLADIKTPQDDFSTVQVAPSYLGGSELGRQNLNIIGTGGLYASMDDLCRFATIFMDGSDGSVLSRASAAEMARPQHQMELITAADTTTRYGLGWDCVELYPFTQWGYQALGKGGSTGKYESYLMVLPEHNLAAAVSSSGGSGQESILAQEIILAVLEEEGLIPAGTTLSIPEQNRMRAPIPQELRSYAGLYDGGIYLGIYNLSFTEDSLFLTPLGVRNERPLEFLYNTDGEFISESGDHLGINSIMAASAGVQGASSLTFAENGKYLVASRVYEEVPGLGITAAPMPLAGRLEQNTPAAAAQKAWDDRNEKEYLLVSEKYTSSCYTTGTVLAKTLTDPRFPGYVLHGIYEGGMAGGRLFPATKITDGNHTLGYQNTPGMAGRDIVNLTAGNRGGVETLSINNFCYVDAAAARPLSELVGGTHTFATETLWADINAEYTGKTLAIEMPENSSWFVYDDEMKCLATSLEKQTRETIVLPEGGRIAFAGEPGAVFTLK